MLSESLRASRGIDNRWMKMKASKNLRASHASRQGTSHAMNKLFGAAAWYSYSYGTAAKVEPRWPPVFVRSTTNKHTKMLSLQSIPKFFSGRAVVLTSSLNIGSGDSHRNGRGGRGPEGAEGGATSPKLYGSARTDALCGSYRSRSVRLARKLA